MSTTQEVLLRMLEREDQTLAVLQRLAVLVEEITQRVTNLESRLPENRVSEPGFCAECDALHNTYHVPGCSRPWQRAALDAQGEG